MPDCHLQREIDVKISGNKKIRCETDWDGEVCKKSTNANTETSQKGFTSHYWKPNLKNEVPVVKKCFPTMPIGHTTFKLLHVLVKSFVDSEKLPCFCEVQKVTKWIRIEMPWCFKWRQVVLELWQHNFGLLCILACGCTSKHLSHCNTSSSNGQEWRFLWIPAMGPGRCP